MTDLAAYAIVAVVVVVTTLAATPLVRRVAIRIGAVVKPDERRVHERPTPTLGGVAMLVGLFAGMLTAWQLDAFDEIFSGSTEPLGIVLAATLIVIVGVVDDLREVSAPAKTAGMVVAASVLVIGGTSILVLRVPFQGTFLLSADWSYLISVIWVVGMANAINFIDGLDGLAAGIVGIAAAAFFLYSMQLADAGLLQDGNAGPLVAIIVLAMCLGFLPVQRAPGEDLHGRLRRAVARAADGRVDDGDRWTHRPTVQRPVVLLLRAAVDPVARSGGADLRHVVRHRAAGPKAHRPRDGRQGPPAPSADATRSRPLAQRADPVGVDGVAVGLRAVPDDHRTGQRPRADRDPRVGPAAVHGPASRR